MVVDRASSRSNGVAPAQVLVIAIAAALIVRGALLWLRGPYLDYDEAMYLLLARSFSAGEGMVLNGLPHTALGPLVPMLTAVLGALVGENLLLAQRIVSALAGSLLLVPVWYLVRHSVGERIAEIAVTLLVAWPALIDVAPKLGPMWSHMYAGSEPVFLFLLFSSFAVAEAALGRRGLSGLALSGLAGACLALAYLCRAEAIVLGALYLIVRGVAWLRQRERAWWQVYRTLPFALAGLVLVAIPHLIYLHRVSDAWIISGQPEVMRPAAETLQETFRHERHLDSYVQTWYRLDAAHSYLLNPYWGTPEGMSRDTQVAQFARIAALEAPVRRSWPARIVNRIWNYGYMLWGLSGPLFAPFVVLGVIVSRRREVPPFVVAAFAASIVTSLYLAVLPRFFLYLAPALAVWSAYGVDAVARFRGRFDLRRPLVALLIVLSLLYVGRRVTGQLAIDLKFAAAEDRRAAENLAAAIPDVKRVLHWHPRFAYWAGWDWRALPVTSLDGLAHYATGLGVNHALLTRVGYAPVKSDVQHLLVILDRDLRARLATLEGRGSGRHVHPRMVLSAVSPVAGYATGRLRLDRPQAR